MDFCKLQNMTKLFNFVSKRSIGSFAQIRSILNEASSESTNPVKRLQPSPDVTTLLNPSYQSKIIKNLVDRLCVQDETEAKQMIEELQALKKATVSEPSSANREALVNAALQFPNFSHANIVDLKEPKVLFDNSDTLKPRKWRSFEDIARVLNGTRTTNTGPVTTEKSYYLLGPLAELEQALIKYTLDYLIDRAGFELISVPDILDPEIIEACGLKTTGKITNVFKLDPRFYGGPKALSGTAEMAFGSLLANKKLDVEKPQKFAAVSRCYRAESTMGKREKGLYRVHHFTKVEMFAVTVADNKISDLIHDQMLSIQQKLFDDFLLHYRVLDMHPGDLGSPASRKYDCEAILPAEEMYGEISSTSNCLDYQSRRLNIRDLDGKFCHTINGTACAVPRMIMAICEQHQLDNGCVDLPPVLRPYMPTFKDYLGPRAKHKRPVFQYQASPKALLS